MFYPALVIDNNTFASTGKIKVRIAKEYLAPMAWDLSQNPTAVNEAYDKNLGVDQDFYAYVLTPFGGKDNNGMYILPRPNTKGLVTKLGDEGSTQYIWVGSYFENEAGRINIPNDKLFDDHKVGASYGSYDIEDRNDILIRTKSMTMPDTFDEKKDDHINKITWAKQKTDNIVSLGKSKIKISHIDYVDANNVSNPQIYEDIYIGEEIFYKNNSQEIDRKERKIHTLCVDTFKNGGSILNSEVKQQADTFLIKVYDEKNSNTTYIEFTNKGEINITANYKNETETKLFVKPTEIKMVCKDTSIKIDNNDNIVLEAKNVVYVSSPEVRLGGGNQKVVTTNSVLNNFELPGGTILNTSSTVFA